MKSALQYKPTAQTYAASASRNAPLRESSRRILPNALTAADLASTPRMVAQKKQLQATFGHALQRRAGSEEDGLQKQAHGALQRQESPQEELRSPNSLIQRQADADAAGEWAVDETVTWGSSDGRPVTIRVLARAFSNHFSPIWKDRIMAGVASMWPDIKSRRNDGTLADLAWGKYVAQGRTTDIAFSVNYDRRSGEVVVYHAHAIQNGRDYPAQLRAAGTEGDFASATSRPVRP